MLERIDFQQNNNEQLSPQLLRKISKNETSEELIIIGEVDYGFLRDDTDLFQDAIIGAFLKNQVIKIVVLDAVSLDTINLLLPVLSNISHLKIRNLCLDRITHLCNELSKSFPKAPIIDLDDDAIDKKSYEQIDCFNRRDKKRELETENEIEDSNKKRRVDNEMVVEEITPAHYAIVQNTRVLPVLPNEIIELPEEEVKAFEQIRQVYLASTTPYIIEPMVKKKKSKNEELQREFLDLTKKTRCSDYNKFISILPKTTSPISDFKCHAFLLAAEQGNRDAVNFLLGGKVRMVLGEPTPENKKAVLAEYELLVIKKYSETLGALKQKMKSHYYLAFKNSQGVYEEKPIIYKIKQFEPSLLCSDSAVIKNVIEYAQAYGASQNFYFVGYLKQHVVSAIIKIALEKGHLQILYDVIEYDELYSRTANNFYCMIERLWLIAVTDNNVALLKHLVTVHKEQINIKSLFIKAIENKKVDLLDSFFDWCLFSDADIESYYLKYTRSLVMQQYFFDSSKNHFYSIAAQSQGYTIQVIYKQKALPEQIDKVIKDAGKSIILLVSSDKKFTIGFNSYGEYKEHRLSDETQEQLMRERSYSINNDSDVVNTSGWLTRHLRLLLLSLSAKTPVQFDPVKLAAIVCSNHGSGLQETLSTLRDNPLALVNLLLTNKHYDLSINDNQFLKQLAEIFNRCNQILDRTPMEQGNIDSIAAMIVSLLSDIRINPVLEHENLDDYVRGIQLCIKNGYHTVLPILLKYKPQQSPLLYEIFLNHTQIMNIALETCEKSHFETIIPILFNELTFYDLSNTEEYILYPELVRQCEYLSMHLEHIYLNTMIYSSNYIAKQQELSALMSVQLRNFEEKLNHDNKNNLRLLKAVVSSPRVFHSKGIDEWVDFLRDRQIYCPDFLTHVNKWGWDKIKPWREVKANPHQFFTHGLFVPNDIFDKITVSYCDVISKR